MVSLTDCQRTRKDKTTPGVKEESFSGTESKTGNNKFIDNFKYQVLLNNFMTREDFSMLEVAQQEEMVDTDGIFIRTQLIGQYLCDLYLYSTYYVLFFYIFNHSKITKSQCFTSLDHIELFVDSIERAHG